MRRREASIKVRYEQGPPYSAKAVANYFLGYRTEEPGIEIDPMKLQKLVYFAHGWHLAITGEPLIDEPVEAWPYGTVVPSVYHEFKHWGPNPIQDWARDFDDTSLFEPHVPRSDRRTLEVLERVWEVYGGLTGIQLSNLTHEEGSPWCAAWERAQKAGKRRGADIDDQAIEQYFRGIALENRQARAARS